MAMRDGGGRNWKQMEWIGWYFEFLCGQILPAVMKIPGPDYGNCGFDGFLDVPWDFKAHVTHNRHGKKNKGNVVINDCEAIDGALAQYGSIGLIMATGRAHFNDVNGSFKRWHDQIKGGTSAYERERVARGARSRPRKTRFDVEEILLLELTRPFVDGCDRFQEGFRNADGSPRRAKIMLNLSKVGERVRIRIPFAPNPPALL